MSQEIQAGVDFIFDKNNAHVEMHFDGMTDVVGENYVKQTLTVAGDTTLDLGNIGVQGFLLIKNTATAGIPAGSVASASVFGAAGTNVYKYVIVAKFDDGSLSVSNEVTISNGNASLDGSNYNILSGSVVFASVYDIYRTYSNGTPSTTGLIAANQATPAFNDQGAAGDGTPVPTPISSNKPILVGPDGSIYPDVILVGDPPCLRRINFSDMPDIHVKANGGNTNIEYLIIEA